MDRELTPKQQTSEAIRQADSILVVTGQRPSVDQVASTLALGSVLRKFGKKVTTVISDELPAGARFLPQSYLERNLDGLRDFIIQVGLNHGEVDKLKYVVEDNQLKIHISPFAGSFSAEDVSYEYGEFHYDLIIVLGVASYARMDKVFAQNQQVLQHIPIANIDYHRSNEQYGAINLIEPNAAGLGEILVALSESLQTGLIDQPIATTLLTGIMASTDRFTATHTTSKAMTVAAQMMAMGADQQAVVRGLYRSDKSAQDNRRQQPRNPQPNPRPAAASVPAPAPMPVPQPVSQPVPATAPAPVPEQPQQQIEAPVVPSAPIHPEEPAPTEAPIIPITPEPTPPQPVPAPALEIIHPMEAQPEIDTEAPVVTDPDSIPTAPSPAVQELVHMPVPPRADYDMPASQPEPLINSQDEVVTKAAPKPATSPASQSHQTASNPTNNPVFANRLPW